MNVGHCIRGKMDSGVISKDYAKELLEKIDEVEKMLRDFPDTDAGQAFEALQARMKEMQVNKKRQYLKTCFAEDRLKAQAEKHPKGFIDGLCSTLTYDLSGKADGVSVEKLAESVQAMSYGEMPTMVLNMKAGIFGGKQNLENGKKFIKALFGDESDELGSKMAAEWQAVTKKLRDRFVAAGGDIGALKDWRIPTSHDADRLQKSGADAWVAFIFPLLDRKKMIDNKTGWPLSKENLKKVLYQSYETLSTRGLNKYGSANKLPLALKHSNGRILHFKDGESWLAYNEKFGNGNPFVTASGYIDNMARDISFIETWGPDPEKLRDKMLAKYKFQSMLDGNKAAAKALKKVDYFERLWNEVSGEAAVPAQPHVFAAKFNAGTRNLLMAAQLGSAFLTQFSDVASNIWTAKFNGLSKMEIPKNLFSLMTSNKKRDFSIHLGLGAEEIISTISGSSDAAGRLLGSALPDGWTRKVASSVMKASLLERMTMASKKAFCLDFVHCLADNAQSEFSGLNKALKNCFERYGLTAEDWNIIRASKFDNLDGAKYVNLIEIAKSGNLDVATKLSNMIFTERDFAVIDSNPRTRAFTLQGTQAGTFMGEALRYMAMYKTFPITILTHHVTRMMTIENMGSRLGYAGGLFAALTLSGYFTVQAKLLASGKKPAEADRWETWKNAMLSGGALGVIGDIFAGETRGDLVADKLLAIAGPGFSLGKDTLDLTVGNAVKAFDGKSSFKKDAAEYVKHYTPFVNLWYTKLATERYLTDKLQMLADKKTRQRFSDRDRQQRQRYGRGYWWNPGENKPSF